MRKVPVTMAMLPAPSAAPSCPAASPGLVDTGEVEVPRSRWELVLPPASPGKKVQHKGDAHLGAGHCHLHHQPQSLVTSIFRTRPAWCKRWHEASLVLLHPQGASPGSSSALSLPCGVTLGPWGDFGPRPPVKPGFQPLAAEELVAGLSSGYSCLIPSHLSAAFSHSSVS